MIKKRKRVPTDGSAKKIIDLAIQNASNKWRACPAKRFGYDAYERVEASLESLYD